MTETALPLPSADSRTELEILKGLARERSLLTALTLMHGYVGRAFQITLPRFQPAVFVGPESNRQILVTDRLKLHSRPATDPATRLLRRGVLVVDGAGHDGVRALMEPALQALSTTFGRWCGLTLWVVPTVLGLALAFWLLVLRAEAWAVLPGMITPLVFLVAIHAAPELFAVWAGSLAILLWKHRAEYRHPPQLSKGILGRWIK
jgi:hypothetical protein